MVSAFTAAAALTARAVEAFSLPSRCSAITRILLIFFAPVRLPYSRPFCLRVATSSAASVTITPLLRFAGAA